MSGNEATTPTLTAIGFRGWLAGIALLSWLVVNCAAGDDGDQAEPLPPTGTGSGGYGQGGALNGGAGGANLECELPEHCTGLDTTCSHRTCLNNECGFEFAPAYTECTENAGKVCDGDGNCVECLDGSHCPEGVCLAEMCVPATCQDTVHNGNETDIDCGGGACPPCVNGKHCLVATDCQSRFCDDSGTGGGNAGGTSASGGMGGSGGGMGGSGAGSGSDLPVCAPCTSDDDCADVADTYCDAASVCADQKANGEPCGGDNECLSGHCPSDDGVCCDMPCDGTCEACLATKTGGVNGVCGAVQAQSDPDGECLTQPSSSCGANGTGCNGDSVAPNCNLYGTSTVCDPATCSQGQFTAAAHCDGGGQCLTNQPVSCDPYKCNSTGTACTNTCANDGECIAGYYCDGGNCYEKKNDGLPCGGDNECKNGHCPVPDSVCCNVACTSTCLACLAYKTGGTDGTCGAVTVNTDPDTECAAELQSTCGSNGAGCNGNMSSPDCQLWDSNTQCVDPVCSAGQETTAGMCDGSGTCVNGTTNSCDPYVCNTANTACRQNCSSDGHCVTGFYCDNGACSPKKINGVACAANNECLNGKCNLQDGVCCNSDCTGSCEACVTAKTGLPNGLCAAVSGNTDPDNECATEPANTCGTTGNCNGLWPNPQCIQWSFGTQCIPPICVAGLQTTAGTCDGLGNCGVGITTACSPYTCNDTNTACRSNCGNDGHCVTGYFCDGGSCTLKKNNGIGCSADNQCVSGICNLQDGVCCNLDCTGECEACVNSKTGLANGTCGAVVGGTDPDSECPTEAATTCGTTGVCNGNWPTPSCSVYDTFTQCAPAACSNGQYANTSYCNGSGSCNTQPWNDCPGKGTTNAVVGCSGINCTFACDGENYDSDDNLSTGCEEADSPTNNHAISTALWYSTTMCHDGDSSFTITGKLPSDARSHDPAVPNFVSTTGSAEDWRYIQHEEEPWYDPCQNDLDITQITISNSSNTR